MTSAFAPHTADPAFRAAAARAFGKGVLFITILIAMLAGWCLLRADDTLSRFAQNLSSKTVVIESIAAEQAAGEGTLRADDMVTPDETIAPPSPAAARVNTPFQKFRKAVPLASGQTQLAIVLTNIGISDSLARTVIADLPADVTLAFSPYSQALDAIALLADGGGFERWMMLPLAPAGYPAAGDAGPLAIVPDGDLPLTGEHAARLTDMGKEGFAGFIAPNNHGFDAQAVDASPAFTALAEQGFAFADARAEGSDAAGAFAEKRAMPYIRADEWLPRNAGRADIQTILQRAEKLSQLNGRAVIMAEATPLSLDLLKEWAGKLPGRNIQLVPLSAIAQ